jgi:hypothetical protein
MAGASKRASTRYDREVAAGNIDYFHVADRAGVDVNDYDASVMKQDLREGLRSMSAPDPASLDRLRAIRDRQFAQSVQPVLSPEERMRRAIMPVQERQELYEQDVERWGARAQVSRNAQGRPIRTRVVEDLNPFNAAFLGSASVGRRTPEMARAYAQGAGGQAAIVAQPVFPALEDTPLRAVSERVRSALDARYFQPEAHDSTSRFAIMRHEVGEGADARAYGYDRLAQPAPHASHLGVTPLIEERAAVLGDPDAYRDISRLRGVNADDRMASRLYTQMGGTPHRPIPNGGRQHRALERAVDASFEEILPAVRSGVGMRALQGWEHQGRNPAPAINAYLSSASEALQNPSDLRGLASKVVAPLRGALPFVKKYFL